VIVGIKCHLSNVSNVNKFATINHIRLEIVNKFDLIFNTIIVNFVYSQKFKQ